MHRVGDLLQEVASEVLLKIKDPAVEGALITITQVQCSPDLSTARFYVSIMGKPVPEVLEALNRGAGYFRREMTKKVHLKRVPAITFAFDEALENGLRMQQLLAQTQAAERAAARERGETDEAPDDDDEEDVDGEDEEEQQELEEAEAHPS